MATGTPAKVKRNQQIVAMRLAGMTFAEIGRKFKITRSMVKQVYDRDLPKFKDMIVKGLDK